MTIVSTEEVSEVVVGRIGKILEAAPNWPEYGQHLINLAVALTLTGRDSHLRCEELAEQINKLTAQLRELRAQRNDLARELEQELILLTGCATTQLPDGRT